MSSVVTFWYDVYSKTTHLDEVTIGIKKDYTPHYLYLLLVTFKITIMKLSINTTELTSEKGTWLATIDWFKYDGGKVGTPGAVKYGNSKEQAYNKLNQLMVAKGHEIIE